MAKSEQNDSMYAANRRDFYESLKASRYDVGKYEDFEREYINDDEGRKLLHGMLKDKGADIPEWEEFSKDMGFSPQTSYDNPRAVSRMEDAPSNTAEKQEKADEAYNKGFDAKAVKKDAKDRNRQYATAEPKNYVEKPVDYAERALNAERPAYMQEGYEWNKADKPNEANKANVTAVNDSNAGADAEEQTSAAVNPDTLSVPQRAQYNFLQSLTEESDTLDAARSSIEEKVTSFNEKYNKAWLETPHTEQEIKEYEDAYKAIDAESAAYEKAAEAYNSKAKTDGWKNDPILNTKVEGTESYSPNGGWTYKQQLDLEALQQEAQKAQHDRIMQNMSRINESVNISKAREYVAKQYSDAEKKFRAEACKITGISDPDKAIKAIELFNQDKFSESALTTTNAMQQKIDELQQRAFAAEKAERGDVKMRGANWMEDAALQGNLGMVGNIAQESGKLTVASRMMDKTLRHLQRYSTERGQRKGFGDESVGFWNSTKNAATGFGQKVIDVDTWDFGMFSVQENAALYAACQKLNNNEKLTEGEQMILDAAAMNIAVEGSLKLGLGFTAGDVTAEALPFMLDMMVNPISAAGEGVGATVARWAMKGLAKKTAAKGVSKLGYTVAKQLVKHGTGTGVALAKGAAMSVSPLQINNTAGMVMEQMAGTVSGEIGEDGLMHANRIENAKDFGEALWYALGQQTAENASEFGGDTTLDPLANVLMYSLGRRARNGKVTSALIKKFDTSSLGRWMARMSKSEFAQFAGKIKELTHTQGAVIEPLEEHLGDIEKIMMGVEDKNIFFDKIDEQTGEVEEGVLSWSNFNDTFLTMLPMQVMFAGVGYGGYGIEKTKASIAKGDAAIMVQGLFGEKANDYLDRINKLDEKDFGEEFKKIVANDEGLDEQKKNALMRYAIAVQYNRGMDAKEKQERIHDANKAVFGGAYDEGYGLTEMQDRKDAATMRTLDLMTLKGVLAKEGKKARPYIEMVQQGRYSEAMDALLRDGAPQEVVTAVENYISSRQKVGGVMAKVNEQYDAQISDMAQQIDQKANKDDGMHYEVTTLGGENGYLVSGAVDEMGRVVGGAYVQIEGEDSPRQLNDGYSFGNVTANDPEQEKAEYAVSVNAQRQAEIDAIMGVVRMPENVGESYTDADGNEYTVKAISDDGVYTLVDKSGKEYTTTQENEQRLSDIAAMATDGVQQIMADRGQQMQQPAENEQQQEATGENSNAGAESEGQQQPVQTGGAVQRTPELESLLALEPVKVMGANGQTMYYMIEDGGQTDGNGNYHVGIYADGTGQDKIGDLGYKNEDEMAALMAPTTDTGEAPVEDEKENGEGNSEKSEDATEPQSDEEALAEYEKQQKEAKEKQEEEMSKQLKELFGMADKSDDVDELLDILETIDKASNNGEALGMADHVKYNSLKRKIQRIKAENAENANSNAGAVAGGAAAENVADETNEPNKANGNDEKPGEKPEGKAKDESQKTKDEGRKANEPTEDERFNKADNRKKREMIMEKGLDPEHPMSAYEAALWIIVKGFKLTSEGMNRDYPHLYKLLSSNKDKARVLRFIDNTNGKDSLQAVADSYFEDLDDATKNVIGDGQEIYNELSALEPSSENALKELWKIAKSMTQPEEMSPRDRYEMEHENGFTKEELDLMSEIQGEYYEDLVNNVPEDEIITIFAASNEEAAAEADAQAEEELRDDIYSSIEEEKNKPTNNNDNGEQEGTATSGTGVQGVAGQAGLEASNAPVNTLGSEGEATDEGTDRQDERGGEETNPEGNDGNVSEEEVPRPEVSEPQQGQPSGAELKQAEIDRIRESYGARVAEIEQQIAELEQKRKHDINEAKANIATNLFGDESTDIKDINKKYDAQVEKLRKQIAEIREQEDAEIKQTERQATLDDAFNEAENGSNAGDVAEEQARPLTVADIDAIPDDVLSATMKTLAKAYINGDAAAKANALNQLAYLKAEQYVRNQSGNVPADSSTASEPQSVGTADARDERGDGRGSEVQGDELDQQAHGEPTGSEGSENGVRPVSGEGGNSNVAAEEPVQPATDGGNSRRGGTDRNDGGNVSRPERAEGGNGDATEDGGRNAETRTVDHTKAGKDKFKAALDKFKKAKKASDSRANLDLLKLVSLGQISADQLEPMMEMVGAVVEMGYGYVESGIRNFRRFMDQFKEDGIYGMLKDDVELTDAQVESFIEDAWNSPYEMNGETFTIAQWAQKMSDEELREALKVSLADKLKMQREAEGVKNKLYDLDNIRESLPYLLPAQQEDVWKAEMQFFNPTHADREHANGKGIMFTNGTGTGKTYTGLGIVKRMIKEGKGRILILTPSAEKVGDWIEDAKNLGIDLRSLEEPDEKDVDENGKKKTATTRKGKGAIITTYANFRANQALLEDDFDLVMYDESHKIMESKNATATSTTRQHYMLTNKNFDEAMNRLKAVHPLWKREKEINDRKKVLKETLKNLQGELRGDGIYAGWRDTFIHAVSEARSQYAGNKEVIGRIDQYISLFNEHSDLDEELDRIKEDQSVELTKMTPRANEAVKNTKVVFLSATPFNTRDNLDYAEGYIFSYPEEDENTKGSRNHRNPRDLFYEKHFGSTVNWRYGKQQKRSDSNEDMVTKQEMAFADYLMSLGTMSTRQIDNGYDYSRDFPIMNVVEAAAFNDALEEMMRNPEMRPLQPHSPFWDYQAMSVLFETMKVAATLPRIKEHIGAGRKVVIFHRRVNDNKNLARPPFALTLENARKKIVLLRMDHNAKSQNEANKIENAIALFEEKYGELLEWEQKLDYRMPRQQLAAAFGDTKEYTPEEARAINDAQQGADRILTTKKNAKEAAELGVRIANVVETEFEAYDILDDYRPMLDPQQGDETDTEFAKRKKEYTDNLKAFNENKKAAKEAIKKRMEERIAAGEVEAPKLDKNGRPAKKVGYFAGQDSKTEKHADVEAFNDDESEMKVIVIQEASGKEGISLHDKTGKHQRVIMQLALPQSPIAFIQIEGRIYRIGQASNAIFEYPLLGINQERTLFATRINGAASTTENLAMGEQARALKQSIMKGVLEHSGNIPIDGQGVGGKEFDTRTANKETGFDGAIKDYYGNQKMQSGRANHENDYYPTPEPLGYKLIEWADLQEGENVLEPSAGHGAVARYVPQDNPMLAVELSTKQFGDLAIITGAAERGSEAARGKSHLIMNSDFMELDENANKFDSVVMNPPYGTGGKEAMEHIEKAWKHLRNGGRLIAIIPDGPAMQKRLDQWLSGEREMTDEEVAAQLFKGGETKTGKVQAAAGAHLVAEVHLPSITFSRAGTGVKTKVIVLDKQEDKNIGRRIDMQGKREITIEDKAKVDDLFEELRDMTMPKRIIDPAAKAEKAAENFRKEMAHNEIFKQSGRGEEKSSDIYMTSRGGQRIMWFRYDQNAGSLWKITELIYERTSKGSYADLPLPTIAKPTQELANNYIKAKAAIEMTPEQLEGEYWVDKQSYQDAKDMLTAWMKMIRKGSGLTENQLERLANGEDVYVPVDLRPGEPITMQKIRELFDGANTDERKQVIFDRVWNIANSLGLKLTYQEMGASTAAVYQGNGVLAINPTAWRRTDRNYSDKANTLLHELIHSVTQYAIVLDERGVKLPENLQKGVDKLKAAYEQAKKGGMWINALPTNERYFLTDLHEFVAEAGSNSTVRKALEKTSIWKMIKDGIKQLFGWNTMSRELAKTAGAEESNLLKEVDEAIDEILDSFDTALWGGYTDEQRIAWATNGHVVVNEKRITDEDLINELDNENKIKVYRAMQVVTDADGRRMLVPPMAGKVDGKWQQGFYLDENNNIIDPQWEMADERPDLVKNGKFTLNKGNGKSVPAAYNPYIHTSLTPLNDQFSEAQNRPNLVVVEMEVPESELTSGYKAEGAKDAVGKVEWKAGIIQGQLSGTRSVILTRYAKPSRIVPDSEVAQKVVEMFGDRKITMPTNVVTPSLREEMEKLGVPFVETDNRGHLINEYGSIGEHYSKIYGNKTRSFDSLGNPINKDGSLKVDNVNNANEISDEDFDNPTRNISLVGISQGLIRALGIRGRRVVIKKNIFGKNRLNHPEITNDKSRDILNRTLYNPNMYGETQPMSNPYYKVAIQTGDRNAVTVLDIYDGKNDVEVVGWREISEKSLRKMQRQAEREGGQLLILSPENGSAADLSTLTSGSLYDGKDTNNNNNSKEKEGNNGINGENSQSGVRYRTRSGQFMRAEYADVISNAITETAKMLGSDVTVINDMTEVKDPNVRKMLSTGRGIAYYDIDKKQVVIYAPNLVDAEDAKRTVLHETLGHKGLRQLIGEEQYDKVMKDLFKQLPSEARQKVVLKALSLMSESKKEKGEGKNRGYRRYLAEAMDEYLAEQAENYDPTQVKWWNKVVGAVRQMIRSLGINVQLTDGDITYLLWRSHMTMRNQEGVASWMWPLRDVKMQKKYGTGIFDPNRNDEPDGPNTPNGGIRWRRQTTPQSTAQMMYNSGVSGVVNRLDEAWHDGLRSLDVIQKAVTKESKGDLTDYQDAYLAMQFLSSVNEAEQSKVAKTLVEPLVKAHAELLKKYDTTEEDLERYMIAVHGLERNEVFARRDARRQAADEYDAQIAAAKAAGDAALEAQLTADKQVREDELYLENRKTDYSGFTETFADGVKPTPSNDDLEQLAKEYIADYEQDKDKADIDKLWELINKLNGYTLNKSRTSGMMSKQTYDEVSTQFEHYIPLRGWDKTTAMDTWDYLVDDNAKGKFQPSLKNAYGRKSQAGDILGTMIAMVNSTILQGNKNLAKQKFLNLAEGHKTKLMSLTSTWYERKPGTTSTWQVVEAPMDATDQMFANEPYYGKKYDEMTADERADMLSLWEDEMRKRQANGETRRSRQGLNLDRPINNEAARQHEVKVYRNGVEYVVSVNGAPNAAQAVNGMLNMDATPNAIDRFFQSGNRMIARAYTSLSPFFMARNFERDMSSALNLSEIKYGKEYLGKLIVNLNKVTPAIGVGTGGRWAARMATGKWDYRENARILAGIGSLYYKLGKGTLDMNDETERLFKEFVENGGQTGYSQLQTIEEHDKAIRKAVKAANRNKGVNKAEEMLHVAATSVEFANKMMENTTRFAVYMTSRQMGKSVLKSVQDAKEASTNFNKKGSGAMGNRWARDLFIFMNASIQGSMRYFDLMRGAEYMHNGQDLKPNIRKRALAGLAMWMTSGALMTVANVMIGSLIAGGDGDDDDDEYYGNPYFNMGDYKRRTQANILLPNGALTYNLGVEESVIWGLGVIVAEHAMGFGRNDAMVGETVAQLSRISPFGSIDPAKWRRMDGVDMIADIGQTFIPSYAQIYTDAFFTNKDFMGRDIANRSDYNRNEPEYKRVRRDTPQWQRDLSETMYNKYGVDVNPNIVDYIVKNNLGGIYDLPIKIANAIDEELKQGQVSASTMPFLDLVWNTTNQPWQQNRAVKAEFDYYKYDIDKMEQAIKNLNSKDKSEKGKADLQKRLENDGRKKYWDLWQDYKKRYDKARKAKDQEALGKIMEEFVKKANEL